MGLLDELFNSPERMGLLSAAAAMAERSGPSTRPTSFGQVLSSGLLGGMQGYQGVQDSQFQREYRTSQMDQHKAKTTAMKAQQDALAGIKSKVELDPTYKPTIAEMLAIDPDSAFKAMAGGNAVDFGLEPKIGINPTTGKHGYFIQDKRGGTKWIDAEVPENYKYVPGTDYRPDQRFNPRTGETSPLQPNASPTRAIPGAGPSMLPIGGPSPMLPSAPEVDPLAPWSRLVASKEQDEMKRQTYSADSKRLDDLREAVRKGRSIMGDLNRFGELNRSQATGSALDSMSWLPTLDNEKREMESIQSRLAPQLRVAGSGSDSDLEQRMRLKALPGIDKPGDVNRNIRLDYERQQREISDELAFKEAYLGDRGHLNGVDELRSNAIENGKSGGLDTSKLNAEQIAYLRQQNPEAFERGVARMQRNGGGQAPAQNKTLLAKLPSANRSNMGKMAIDHETGKRYKSNGLQWVEVQ